MNVLKKMQHPIHPIKKQYIILLFLLLPTLCFALPNDKEKPLKVSSDFAQVNYHNGIVTNIGHVIIDQGTSHLKGDKVITYYNKQHQITKIISYGKPAYYNTLLSLNTPILYTRARTIIYYPLKHLVVLRDHAVAERGPNSIRAPLINYDLSKQQLSTSPNGGNTTTHAVINNEAGKNKEPNHE